MENKWIILMQCGNSPEPAWFTSSDPAVKEVPVLHDTQKEAVEKVLENFIDSLSIQLDEVREDARDLDDVDLQCDEWVEPCTLHEDGVITIESGELYNPKTYVR